MEKTLSIDLSVLLGKDGFTYEELREMVIAVLISKEKLIEYGIITLKYFTYYFNDEYIFVNVIADENKVNNKDKIYFSKVSLAENLTIEFLKNLLTILNDKEYNSASISDDYVLLEIRKNPLKDINEYIITDRYDEYSDLIDELSDDDYEPKGEE